MLLSVSHGHGIITPEGMLAAQGNWPILLQFSSTLCVRSTLTQWTLHLPILVSRQFVFVAYSLFKKQQHQVPTLLFQVLYNLFEWPTRAGSRLAMIGVANTMDLPERLLPRIASRLGGKRTVFQPYSRPQLATIVDARLSEAGLAHTFARNAVNMACSKVGQTKV